MFSIAFTTLPTRTPRSAVLVVVAMHIPDMGSQTSRGLLFTHTAFTLQVAKRTPRGMILLAIDVFDYIFKSK